MFMVPLHQERGATLGKIATLHQLEEAITRAKTIEGPLIIKFGAEWCGPCTRIQQKFEELIEEFKCMSYFVLVSYDTFVSALLLS